MPLKSRRTFLKVGLLGGAVLAAAGGAYRFSHRAPSAAPFILDGAAAAAISRIIPVVLQDAGLVTPADQAAAIERVIGAIAGLPLATQSEIQDLFSLLAFAPARRLLAGVHAPWHLAEQSDITAFLQSWRTHRIGVFQSGYAALHDLILGSWYAAPSSWVAIGYPGPSLAMS